MLARGAVGIALVALLVGGMTGCATGDGRQLRDPVFDLPAPPVTLLDVTPQEIPTLPPFSLAPTSEPVLETIVAQSSVEIEDADTVCVTDACSQVS
ncbi:MAG TPA: hypothetical protein VLA10_03735, partial [Ilumatobacter sp.]|nr:hypothetical protein [Ilumatobacter sp.]